MRKIVSAKNGYTYFYENESNNMDCVIFETGEHMSGADIARELNITRSAVSQSLRRSIKRIYSYIKNRNNGLSTIEVMSIMANMFNVKTNSQYKKFFNLFPINIKGEFYAEAKKVGYCWD